MTVSHKENCVCVTKTIKQESLWASGNVHSSKSIRIWSDVLLFHPPENPAKYSHSRLHKSINITFPFLLQPITFNEELKYHHVFISYGGLDS